MNCFIKSEGAESSGSRIRISKRLYFPFKKKDETTREEVTAQPANGSESRIKVLWRKTLVVLKRYSSFIGPGLMVSVAYMDPGNYATGITAGASNRFSLLTIVLFSNIIAIFLQSLCIKLGSVTGHDLARCCREYLPRWLNIILWILAECAIIATDVAEVVGSAVALNILLKIPLPAGVVITIVDVIFVLMAYRNDTSSTRFVKLFEYVIALLVMAVVVCFAVELAKIPVDFQEQVDILRGFVPSKQMFESSGITIATSIIGSTVMIHSLFLGSGIVQPRLREYDVKNGIVKLDELLDENDRRALNEDPKAEKLKVVADKEASFFYRAYKPSYQAVMYSMKYSIAELVITLFTFALFVNLAILVIAGSTLYGTPEALDADLYTIHDLLSRNLAPAIGTTFMLALLFSGQSAGIVCTIAGQIVSEGHINWTLRPWLRRLVTRSISIIPCLAISVSIGRSGMNIALNISQVIISLLLPFLSAPLIYFTCKKSIMRIEIPPSVVAESDDSARITTTEYADQESNQSGGKKYKYMQNNWITTIIVVLIWILVSVMNVYAIVQMAQDGVNG